VVFIVVAHNSSSHESSSGAFYSMAGGFNEWSKQGFPVEERTGGMA
jgi:hypothetical protein